MSSSEYKNKVLKDGFVHICMDTYSFVHPDAERNHLEPKIWKSNIFAWIQEFYNNNSKFLDTGLVKQS